MRLVFDIETVGENWDSLDPISRNVLSKWVDEEDPSAMDELKNGLGLSPLTGEIVAIGIMDVDSSQGAVYYQSPQTSETETKEGNFVFRPGSEKEILDLFWKAAERYSEFISYNGRCFDAPYLMIRSAIHGIRPSKNLLEGRYAYQQRNCRHVDLQDELTFYGAMPKKGGLHMWSRAFGITSPKAGGTNGGDVGELFKEKKFLEIAKYNVGDLIATAELYKKWEANLKF